MSDQMTGAKLSAPGMPMEPPAQGTGEALNRMAGEQLLRNERYLGSGYQGTPPPPSYTPPEAVTSRSGPGPGPQDVAQTHNNP